MKHIIRYIAFSITSVAMACCMASCDTDVESVKLNEPGIENQNANLYQKYLENLKAYKASNHKIVLGWFDNSHLTPNSQGQQMTAVPDSLDYLVLTHPTTLNDESLKSMEALRTQKATKVLYEINFDNIKSIYSSAEKAFSEKEENKGKKFKTFNDYLVDSVKTALSWCTKYNYDGVIMSYSGKEKYYMGEEEKALYSSYEADFIGISIDWAQRHTDKTFIFQGKPQNVMDTEVFKLAKYIVVPCYAEKSVSGVAYTVNLVTVEGVSTEKLIPSVMMTSIDPTDTKTGYWDYKRSAVLGTARWAATAHQQYNIAGLGIVGINADYYHPVFTYSATRRAISILNPTVKQ